MGYTVMIVGDDPSGKIASAKVRKEYETAIRLGQFWKTDLAGKPRTAQFAFFEHLRQLAPTVTHVGMRSGNLEAYAYMGHRVLFIEERDRSDATRMDKLVGIDTTLKYRSVRIEDLPTRTGRALMEDPAPRLEDDVTSETVSATGARYELRDEVEKRLGQLKKQAKVLTADQSSAKARKAYGMLVKRLGADGVRRLEAWIAHTRTPVAPHQRALKDYQFVKRHYPEIFKGVAKGFSKQDLGKITKATATRFDKSDGGDEVLVPAVFWQVSVPEDQIPAFTAADVRTVEPPGKLAGRDGHVYMLSAVREHRERVGSAHVAPHIERTTVYDFVRLPD